MVEGKHRKNGGNKDMVGVENLSKIVLHGMDNHGDSYKHSLASLQMIFNKNFMHKA